MVAIVTGFYIVFCDKLLENSPIHLIAWIAHQYLIRRAPDRLFSSPVQMADPTACHSTEPPAGFHDDDTAAFSFSCHCSHHAAGRAPVDTTICCKRLFS